MILKYRSVIILFSLIILLPECDYQEGRRETFNQIIGTYTLDTKQTSLGSNYQGDSMLYSKLMITFSRDSTFFTNFDVPFMYNSKGRWTAGNIHEWCRLLFDGLNYDGLSYPGTQFTRPFSRGIDTFLLMVSTTPKDNFKTITKIYFKKVKP